jgi:peptide/nickel transport system substrate-binding protein
MEMVQPVKFGLAALAIGAALACAPSGAMAQKSKDTLRYVDSFNLDVIDAYHTGAREITMVIGEMAFDTLVYRDPKTFEHKPLLAKSWKWVNDTTLEFDLRNDVKWHDGQPFTADDVVYTFMYTLDPNNKVYHRDWVKWVKTVEAVGPHKVRMNLDAPFGPALEYISLLMPIIPKDFYDANGKAGANGRLVGTGPYKITEFVPSKGVKFEINKNYIKNGPKGTPSIGKIEMRVLPDLATQVAEILSGGADWIWRVSPNNIENIRKMKGLQVASGGTMRMTWMSFDIEGKTGDTFKDQRVRQAFAHAIDRVQLVREVIGDGGHVLETACFPRQFGCATNVPKYEYNPEKAKKLLAEAGYPNGLQVTLHSHASAPQPVIVEAVQGFMRKAGVDLKLNIHGNFKPFYEAMAKGQVPVSIASYGNYNIGDVQIAVPLYFGGESRDQVRDPDMIAAIKEASSISDPARRKVLLEKVTKSAIEKSYWVPLLLQSVHYAYSQDLDIPLWDDENPRFYMAKWKK